MKTQIRLRFAQKGGSMKNRHFPAGLSADIANRLDGILDSIDDSTRGILRDPTVDELIEELVEDVEGLGAQPFRRN